MKKIHPIILLAVLSSCEQPKIEQGKEIKPKDEISLVNKFKTADSIYRRQRNDIRRSEVSDSAQNSISNYIIKDLNLRSDKWVATIYEMTMNDFPKSVDVKFMIPLKNDPDTKYPETEAIVLLANVNYKSKRIVDSLKGLKTGDTVLVTGKFNKIADGSVNFTLYSNSPDDYFANPHFIVDLTDISKK